MFNAQICVSIDTLLSPADAGAGAPVVWSVFIPANSLESSKDYMLVAADTDELAAASQAIHTS
jgi:hypothetical protein